METITLQNISDFKDGGQLYTADNRYNPCVQLTAGTSLTLDRAHLNLDSLPSKSTFSIWLKREAGAILKIGTADDYVQITEDGKLSLTNGSSIGSPVGSVSLPFRLGVANSDFVTVDTNGNAIATADEWHHLVWVKKDNQHTLYLNGIACQAQTLPVLSNPATINTITAEEAAVYVVHFHGYNRALEAAEVVADKMSQYNATKNFTDQYPLNFTLKDRSIEGAPEMSDDKLIIEDITAKERTYQRLVITNVSGEALRFLERTGEVSNTNHHLEVRFRNGTFVSPSEYPKFDNFETDNLLAGEPSGIPADWQATAPLQHPQDGSWSVYLLRTTALEVASNDTLEFSFEYTTADGSLGGRSTRVTLSYQQMEYADDGQAVAGIREKQIDIINNSSNNAHVSALNEKVTEADAKVDKLEKDVQTSIGTLEDLLTTSNNRKTEIDSAKVDAETARKNAQAAEANAKIEKEQAEAAKTAAEAARQNAQDAETNAIREKEEAKAAKTAAVDAQTKADKAKEAAEAAVQDAINGGAEEKRKAEAAKTAAEAAQAAADAAKVLAEQEKEEAVQAKTAAETALQNAQAAETNAIREKEEAEAAKTAAETAQNAAEQAKQDLLDAASGTNGQIGFSDGEDRSVNRVLGPSTISNGTLGEFFTGVIDTFKTLSANIKAVDDEVDARAAASDYIADQQETPFPLVASVCALTHDNEPAAGVVCGVSTSKLQFTLNNIGLSPVTFTENAEFRFIIPKGADADKAGADKLVKTLSEAGTMEPQSGSPSEVSDTVVFKWNPGKTANEDKVIVNGTTGTLSIAGKTISFTLESGTVMVDHTPTVSYNQTTEGAARVATSINNGKLSVTITGKRVGNTDTWPSVADLENSLNGLSGVSGASGGTGTLEPNTVSGSIASRESKTFTISGITPNATPGFVTIFIEYQGIVGYPSGKLSVAVSKVSTDIAQLVGGGNVGIGTNDPQMKLHIEGANPELLIKGTSNDENATLSVYGPGQGTGRVYVGQSSSYGGGIEYNGDGSPVTTGAGSDYITLWRRNNGDDQWTARNPYNSDNWEFRGNVGIGMTAINSDIKLQVAGNINTTGKLKEDGHDLIPVGTIVMWNGSHTSIPGGWVLCNGANGSPDLRDRFIVGAGNSYNKGNTGGDNTITLTEHQMPFHSHTITVEGASVIKSNQSSQSVVTDLIRRGDIDSGSTRSAYNDKSTKKISDMIHDSHNHSASCDPKGSSHAHENRPPYYALAFIMKT